MEYLIFHPSHPGRIWAEFSEDGTTSNQILANIISRMRDGVYTASGYKLRCVPNIRKKIGKTQKKDGERPKPRVLSLVTKASDCTTLGKLFAPKKMQRNQAGLKTISEKNRYKGKIDWTANREQIAVWISQGLSLGKIAKRLKVSPSTLSEANKRHELYAPRKQVAEQRIEGG